MNNLFRHLKFVAMSIRQIGQQKLQRRLEPDAITSSVESTQDYDFVMTTPLALTYSVIWQTIAKIIPDEKRRRALDLCCGPGHFSIGLFEHLKFQSVQGIDLSDEMIKIARQNGKKKSDQIAFTKADIRNLKSYSEQKYDVVTFTNAAHHFSTIEEVQNILREMERVTHPEGAVVIGDLVRLKSLELTDSYIRFTKEQLQKPGLKDFFFEDFKNSMFAAWTAKELASSIPAESNRQWYQIIPRGLPTLQIIIGVHAHQKEIFRQQSSHLQFALSSVLPSFLRLDFKMLNLLMLGQKPQQIFKKP